MAEPVEGVGAPPLKTLLLLSVPALVIGVGSALMLWALDVVSELMQHWIWTTLPGVFGADGASGWWILGTLTLTGLAVGLSIRFLPGHGGRDSATTELVAPPLPLMALPGLILVVLLGLAGGVSLGPENPTIAINTALVVALLARLWPKVPVEVAVMITAAATIGALFGTPVAAALVFTGIVAAAKGGGALWDRLFLPLVAAGAGALTMHLLGSPSFSLGLPAYGSPQAIDALSGTLIAAAAVGLGLLGIWVFPAVHRFFHSLGNPILYVTLGGFVLGLLGMLGGPITLFKGLHEMGELITNASDYTAAQLLLFTLVKLAALVVAASAGFRGGRIFPAVFIGVAVGLLASSLFPSVPMGLAVACGVLGLVLAVARDGWLALFMGVLIVGDITVLPILCVIILPTWLLVSRAPEMLIHPTEPTIAAPAGR